LRAGIAGFVYGRPAFGTDKEVQLDASPLHHAQQPRDKPLQFPFLLLTAEGDYRSQPDDANTLVDAMREHKTAVNAEHQVISSCNHISIVFNMRYPEKDATSPVIVDFIRQNIPIRNGS